MTRGDVLHALGTIRAGVTDAQFRSLAATYELSPEEIIYVDYCSTSEDPAKRSYDQLRKWLAWNVEDNHGVLERMLETCAKFLRDNWLEPCNIFDIGAGHTAWFDLLGHVWPEAQVFAVDRFKIDGLDWRSIEEDAVEFLAGLREEKPTLLFMSEFLHGKLRSLETLKLESIKDCAILVVEPDAQEHAIGDRLKLTGGGLLTPDQVLAVRGGHTRSLLQRHVATFRYWDLLIVPEAT